MKRLQEFMDRIPQGVFVVGTRMGESYNLMTAAFVTQVSFNPCSLAVSVANNHYTAELIGPTGEFSLSVLAAGQELTAKVCGFQSGRRVDKSKSVEYRLEAGLPVVAGSAAYLICKVRQTVAYADHTVFFAEITEGGAGEAQPLIYVSKDYF